MEKLSLTFEQKFQPICRTLARFAQQLAQPSSNFCQRLFDMLLTRCGIAAFGQGNKERAEPEGRSARFLNTELLLLVVAGKLDNQAGVLGRGSPPANALRVVSTSAFDSSAMPWAGGFPKQARDAADRL